MSLSCWGCGFHLIAQLLFWGGEYYSPVLVGGFRRQVCERQFRVRLLLDRLRGSLASYLVSRWTLAGNKASLRNSKLRYR